MSDLAITNSFSAGDAIVASEMNTNFGNITTWANGSPNIGVSGSTATMDGALTVTEALIASSTSQFNGTVTVGVDDTGHDVKFFGATATNGYMLWDESTDDLILGSASKLGIGIAAPTDSLYVQAAGSNVTAVGITVENTAADSNPHLVLKNDAREWKVQNQADTFVIRDQTATANRLSIGTTGLVGIGIVPTGTAMLSVHGGLRFTAAAAEGDIYTGVGATGSDILGICTGGTERIRVQATTHTADVFVGQTSTYSIGGSSDGNTFINSATGKITYHRINNATIMNVNANGVRIGSGDSSAGSGQSLVVDGREVPGVYYGTSSRSAALTVTHNGMLAIDTALNITIDCAVGDVIQYTFDTYVATSTNIAHFLPYTLNGTTTVSMMPIGVQTFGPAFWTAAESASKSYTYTYKTVTADVISDEVTVGLYCNTANVAHAIIDANIGFRATLTNLGPDIS